VPPRGTDRAQDVSTRVGPHHQGRVHPEPFPASGGRQTRKSVFTHPAHDWRQNDGNAAAQPRELPYGILSPRPTLGHAQIDPKTNPQHPESCKPDARLSFFAFFIIDQILSKGRSRAYAGAQFVTGYPEKFIPPVHSGFPKNLLCTPLFSRPPFSGSARFLVVWGL
jgi:hypothetical protein